MNVLLNSGSFVKNHVLINGDQNSVQAPRARALFHSDQSIFSFKSQGRIQSIPQFWKALSQQTSQRIYCIDLGFPQALLAALRKKTSRTHSQLVYEIGDPMVPLLSGQGRSRFELAVAGWMDKHLPKSADALVFRGSYLYDYFQKLHPQRPLPPSLWLPDGVDVSCFKPLKGDPRVSQLRSKLGLTDQFVVGLVGNIHHNRIQNLYYGWELVEALSRMPDSSKITAVIVGDGPGRAVLESAVDQRRMTEKFRIIGRVPHADVPLWMNVFDVAISTQTDDPVGWGRTTAKLPEYLACGLPVVCSDVGEAHRLLAQTGQTLPYRGIKDHTYPEKLAQRLLELSQMPLDEYRQLNRTLAMNRFQFKLLRERLALFLELLDNNQLKSGDFLMD